SRRRHTRWPRDWSSDVCSSDLKVREVYIGSGAAALAAKPRVSAAGTTPLLVVDKVDTFYGKSHILNAVSLDVREHEIVALLGRRSEERRVGKEGRCRVAAEDEE